jgi:hypothetical protein
MDLSSFPFGFQKSLGLTVSLRKLFRYVCYSY